MTLNILFFSITIGKQKMSLQKAAHNQAVERLYDQVKDRQVSIHHIR